MKNKRININEKNKTKSELTTIIINSFINIASDLYIVCISLQDASNHRWRLSKFVDFEAQYQQWSFSISIFILVHMHTIKIIKK